MNEEEHEHDWQLLESAITNTSHSSTASVPNKVKFICHCGKYKAVDTEKIRQKTENWSNTGKMI